MDNQIKERIEQIRKNSLLKYCAIVMLITVFLLPKIASASSITPEKLIDLTNQEREKMGLNDLVASPLLAHAAQAKAEAILKSEDFSHTLAGRTFSSWIKETGYQYSFVGENLAMDFETSEGIMGAWMDSPLHKKNILNSRYKEIGIASVRGTFQGQETTVVSQIFGTPLTPTIEPTQTSIDSFEKGLSALSGRTITRIDNGIYVLATGAGNLGMDIRSVTFKSANDLKNINLQNIMDNFYNQEYMILFANVLGVAFLIYLNVCISIFFTFALLLLAFELLAVERREAVTEPLFN